MIADVPFIHSVEEVEDCHKKVVDKNLASIEGEYTAVKEKPSKEMEDLKASHKSDLAKLKKDYDDQLGKIK
ncbi:hypothetical protein A2U01_0056461, partial [Trifolium medium]|nr:hypothetical protein [Trifolium medium]